MKTLLLPIALLMTSTVYAEENLTTPADLPEAEQNKIFEYHTEYNRCMMNSRLEASTSGQNVKEQANTILVGCEQHLDGLKEFLLSNNVNENLAIGMTKKMRSRAARQLMTKGMNQMAQQAQAVIKAEQIKAEEAAAQ
jgi:hypothetical protein